MNFGFLGDNKPVFNSQVSVFIEKSVRGGLTALKIPSHLLKQNTVEPLLTDNSIIQTLLQYEHL